MGLLTLFSKPSQPGLMRLPKGSFTVDAQGRTLASTLPQTFPEGQMQEIARLVLEALRTAPEVCLPLRELNIQFAALKLVAREMRGGAIIFLLPQTFEKT